MISDVGKSGYLEVDVEIPGLFASSFWEDMIITDIQVTISKGDQTQVKQEQVSGSSVSVAFDEVEVGKWDVKVTARNEQFAIMEGEETVYINHDALTTVNITLEPALAEVEVHVQIPDDKIQTGEVILVNPTGDNLSQDVEIVGLSGIASFQGIAPREWSMNVYLYDGDRQQVLKGEDSVCIYPGRLNQVSVQFVGEIVIEVGWELPPSRPENIQALYDGSNVTIDWDPVEGAEEYVIFRSNSADGNRVLVTPTPVFDISFVDIDAQPDSSYVYWVQGIGRKGVYSSLSEPSNIVHTSAQYYSTDYMGLELGATWVYAFSENSQENVNGEISVEQRDGELLFKVSDVLQDGSVTLFTVEGIASYDDGEEEYITHKIGRTADGDYIMYDPLGEPRTMLKAPLAPGDSVGGSMLYGYYDTTVMESKDIFVPAGAFNTWVWERTNGDEQQYIDGDFREYMSSHHTATSWFAPHVGDVRLHLFEWRNYRYENAWVNPGGDWAYAQQPTGEDATYYQEYVRELSVEIVVELVSYRVEDL